MSKIRLTQLSADPSQPSTDNGTKTALIYLVDDSGSPVPKTIDSDGNINDFVGPQGPTGPAGPTGPQGPAGSLAKLSVANIDDPSSELASETGATGDSLVVYEDDDPLQCTFYVFDSTVTVPDSIPYIVTGTSGKWIAKCGKYQNGDSNLTGSISLTGTVDGRDIAADGTKLDGIDTGATADAPGSSIQSVGSSNQAGSNATFARDDHVHNHGNQGGGSEHAVATTSVAGFMSASDKTKLDGISDPDFNIQTMVEDEFPPNDEDSDELGALGWRRTASGTGNQGLMIDGVANHPGIYRMGCGTAAAARSTIYLGEPGNDMLVLGSGEIQYDTIVRGTGSIGQFERFLAGLAQRVTTNAEWTDGVYFRILTGGTNWEFVSANGGTRTVVDTGIAYTSTNWIRLGFTINAAGTSIQARVNGTDAGSAITTNIPTAALSLTFLSGALAAGGGSNSTLDADFVRLVIKYTGDRND